MPEINALSNAMAGIYRGMDGMRKNASEIASATQLESGGTAQSLTRPIIEMKENQQLVQASAMAVRIIDETIGSLFDEKA